MKELFSAIVGEENVYLNEPMAGHTTFKIGGPCDCLVCPLSIEAFGKVLATCAKEDIPYFVLGNGSNILVSDEGIRGVVVSTEKLTHHHIEGTTIEVEAGALLADVSTLALEAGLRGLEFACGIPGSIGGAVYMNAGAYDGEMREVIEKVTLFDAQGNRVVLGNEEMAFSYRHSRLKDEPLLCASVTLSLQAGEKDAIRAKIEDLTERRESKQPLELPSAGSTFKRPVGYYAGVLIIEAGLQGHQIGGAQVSTKHAGFVVNVDHATADDVIRLIYHIQQTILEKNQVRLETEVRFIGAWENHPLIDKIMKTE